MHGGRGPDGRGGPGAARELRRGRRAGRNIECVLSDLKTVTTSELLNEQLIMRLVRPVWIRALIMPTRSLQVGRALKLSLDGATVDDAGATVGEDGGRTVAERR